MLSVSSLTRLFVMLLCANLSQVVVPIVSSAEPLEAKISTQSSSRSPLTLESPSWTIQSLSHFIEDYRCAAPLPVAPHLNSQMTNRYEMAALLVTCLEYLGDRTLNPYEQKTLQTLRSEFGLELAVLQGNSTSMALSTRNPTAPSINPTAPSITPDLTPVMLATNSGSLMSSEGFNSGLQADQFAEMAQVIHQPLSWQVQDGNLRFSGTFIPADSLLKRFNTVKDGTWSCPGISCNNMHWHNLSHSTATFEYAHPLGSQEKHRLAMGLHYFDGQTNDEVAHKRLGLNAEATFGKIGLFGRYSVGLRSNLDQSNLLKDRNLSIWSAGIGIRDFIIPKSLLTLSAEQASRLNSLQSAQINYGAFYQFPVGERLVLSPSVVIMANPDHSSNSPQIQGMLQASFSF